MKLPKYMLRAMFDSLPAILKLEEYSQIKDWSSKDDLASALAYALSKRDFCREDAKDPIERCPNHWDNNQCIKSFGHNDEHVYAMSQRWLEERT